MDVVAAVRARYAAAPSCVPIRHDANLVGLCLRIREDDDDEYEGCGISRDAAVASSLLPEEAVSVVDLLVEGSVSCVQGQAMSAWVGDGEESLDFGLRLCSGCTRSTAADADVFQCRVCGLLVCGACYASNPCCTSHGVRAARSTRGLTAVCRVCGDGLQHTDEFPARRCRGCTTTSKATTAKPVQGAWRRTGVNEFLGLGMMADWVPVARVRNGTGSAWVLARAGPSPSSRFQSLVVLEVKHTLCPGVSMLGLAMSPAALVAAAAQVPLGHLLSDMGFEEAVPAVPVERALEPLVN